MKLFPVIFATGFCLLTACGGGGGNGNAKPSSSASAPTLSSAASSSDSSTAFSRVSSLSSSVSSHISSSVSSHISSSSSSDAQRACRDVDEAALFSCLAGSYALRTYANTNINANSVYQSVSIEQQGDINFTLADGVEPYARSEALQTLDQRGDDIARYRIDFATRTLTLFFNAEGDLNDIEITTAEQLTGLSLRPQQLTLAEHQLHPDAMLSNGIAGTLIPGERVKAYYRDLPDDSFFIDTHLFLKGVDASDYWTVNLATPTKLNKNTAYACGIFNNNTNYVELTLNGTLFSSRFGGECVVQLTAIELIQQTQLVDYIDAELVAILYSENRREALRLTDTRLRMDVN